MCVCVCICPLKYLLQLYVSCGNSQLSSTQKVCGRWLLSWDSAFSGTYCQCLSILFLISPLSIHHYPFLLDKYCISFIQDESHRYQTPWLASCLPSFLEHLLPCTVARVMRCPLRMPNHPSVFLFRFHPSKSEIKHAAFLRHKTWDRLSVGGFQSCLLAWPLFASRKWDDKDCGSLVTHPCRSTGAASRSWWIWFCSCHTEWRENKTKVRTI